jgi:hypothetical protein
LEAWHHLDKGKHVAGGERAVLDCFFVERGFLFATGHFDERRFGFDGDLRGDGGGREAEIGDARSVERDGDGALNGAESGGFGSDGVVADGDKGELVEALRVGKCVAGEAGLTGAERELGAGDGASGGILYDAFDGTGDGLRMKRSGRGERGDGESSHGWPWVLPSKASAELMRWKGSGFSAGGEAGDVDEGPFVCAVADDGVAHRRFDAEEDAFAGLFEDFGGKADLRAHGGGGEMAHVDHGADGVPTFGEMLLDEIARSALHPEDHPRSAEDASAFEPEEGDGGGIVDGKEFFMGKAGGDLHVSVLQRRRGSPVSAPR